MTYRRRRVDIDAAIFRDMHLQGEWLVASFSVPSYEGMPESAIDHRLDFAVREVDILLGYALTDALLAGWVVVPPIQAREYDELGYGFPENNRHVVQRRVRLEKTRISDASYRDWAIARVDFTVEPVDYSLDSRSHPWSIYEPTYEEEVVNAK